MTNDYEGGYKKPPKHSQFKPGQSGNPKGRPKGSKGLKTVLMEELTEKVDLKIGGRRHRMSQQRVMIKSLINKAAKGNHQAAGKIFELYFKVMRLQDEASEAGEPLTGDELEILQNLEARLLKKALDEARSGGRDQS